MHGMACPGLGRPVRWCWTVPYAGSEIVALLTYGQFTARTLPVSGLSTAVNPGGASPLTLHTVARPPPDAFPLIASHPLQCRAVGARDLGQIEPYPEPSRDEALRVGWREGRAVQDRLLPGRWSNDGRGRCRFAGPRVGYLGRPCSDLRRLRYGASSWMVGTAGT